MTDIIQTWSAAELVARPLVFFRLFTFVDHLPPFHTIPSILFCHIISLHDLLQYLHGSSVIVLFSS